MPRTSTPKRTPRGSKSSSKKRTSAATSAATGSLNPLRTGMPSLDSIVEVLTKTPRAGSAVAAAASSAAAPAVFRIIRTNEVDGYEKGAAEAVTGAAMAAAAPTGDAFEGKARRAAKISIAKAKVESFGDLTDLIDSLPADQDMINRKPPIKTTQTSNRVKEEKRNVLVSVFLYAASKEDDNDFHLILGRDPDSAPELYMNMELSGLPPKNSSAFDQLNEARNEFKRMIDELFEGDLPGSRYDFYDPPVPVTIQGSLFFDMTHAKGQRPGPQSLKSRIPRIWEVHPITKFKFD